MKGLTFGCDVEYFLKQQGVNNPQAACGWFGGTKQEPVQFPGEEKGFMYQEDGCTLELNTPVSTSAVEFKRRVKQMILLAHHLVEIKAPSDHMLCLDSPTMYLNSSSMSGRGRYIPRKKYPQAYVIGCDPDFDAYLMNQRPLMDIGELGDMRFAGGHIHVGYDVAACPRELFVRCMDAYLAPIHKKLYDMGDYAANLRFNFYGYPGIFRPKEYGVEYRSLNSMWTTKLLDQTITVLKKMEKDWTTDRAKFYEKGMEIPSLSGQIMKITGYHNIPRGHTKESCGYPDNNFAFG